MADKKKYIHVMTVSIFCCILLHSCDAPRNNPYDPRNSNSPFAALQGSIQTYQSPNTPVGGVLIIWKNQNRMATSDENGLYLLAGLLPRNGWVIFQKMGFSTDSSWIDWSSGGSQVKNMSLHQLPLLTGRVQSSRVPPKPLVEVKVTWLQQNQFTYTDVNGYFTFSSPWSESCTLTFEKGGYKSASVNIEWSDDAAITQNIFMNALPVVSSFNIYSIVENNYGPRRTYQMVVDAKISDEENDIDSVYIANAALGIKAYLAYDVLAKKFHRDFSTTDLRLNSLMQVVGHDFSLNVVDQANEVFTLGTERVERVIQDEIEIDSPKNGDSVDNTISVKWSPFAPGFPFSYAVQIYTNDDFTPELIWQKENISADSLSQIVTAALEPTEYVWMIWCVDEFHNCSRSKPGSFKIEQ
jgi:hypothetical protein